MISFIAALALSIVNSIIAVIVVREAIDKEWEKFIKLVIGSMIIRFALVLFMIYLFVIVFNYDELIFPLTFMISTFCMIMWEILYLNSKSNLVNLKISKSLK